MTHERFALKLLSERGYPYLMILASEPKWILGSNEKPLIQFSTTELEHIASQRGITLKDELL